MKKLSTLFALLLLLTGAVQAQSSCTPDPQFTSPGIYPLPTSGTFTGTENVAFTQVFTVNVPADTTIDLTAIIGFPTPPVNVTVNYQEITGVNGLPTGLAYNCDVMSCNWVGGTSGCLEISGTPTQTGQFTFNMLGNLNITVPSGIPVIGGTAQNIPTPLAYQLTIDPSVSVDPALNSAFTVSQNSPNPFGYRTEINVFSPFSANLSLEVYDLQGKVVQRDAFSQVAGDFSFEIDASALTPGIYLYRLDNGQTSVIQKMMVNR